MSLSTVKDSVYAFQHRCELPTMDTYVKLLQSYGGRDKIMRTSAYAAVLLSGSMQSKGKARLTAFAKQISAARVVLRLFDDIPMWRLTRNWAAEVREMNFLPTKLICI